MTTESSSADVAKWLNAQDGYAKFRNYSVAGFQILEAMDGDQLQRNLEKWNDVSKFAAAFCSITDSDPRYLEFQGFLSTFHTKLTNALPGQ